MKKIVIPALMAIFLSPFTTAEQINDHLKPDGLISQEEAIMFQNTYMQWRQENLHNAYYSKMPTSFTFELDRLKQYIAYIEAEAERLGHSDLALRVYLAAYPPGYKDNDYSETTIFFAPAAKDTGGGVNERYGPPDTGGNGQDKYTTVNAIEPFNNGGGGNGGYPTPTSD